MDSNLPPVSPGTPPPLNPPPPIIVPPPPAAPRKSSAVWIVIAIVLFVLLGLSLLLNFGQMSVAGLAGTNQRSGTPRLDELVLEDNHSSEKIAVVPVEGIISGGFGDGAGFSMVEIIQAQLERAEEDRRVKAVVLRVDSPGGEVLASDDIARAIREFQDSSGKPVIASMGSLAASGGYYVSAPCRWIVANELTITGSIGVIMSGFNYRGLMDKVGLRPEVYKSGKFKDMLRGSKTQEEITPEERAMVQKLIDETYQKFKSVVADGRKAAHDENDDARALAGNWSEFADGRLLSGKEAFDVGFVDQLGSFEDAVAKAKELGGIEDANVVEFRQRNELAELFSLFGKSEGRAIKVDLGVDLPRIQAGRMYFLSPIYLP